MNKKEKEIRLNRKFIRVNEDERELIKRRMKIASYKKFSSFARDLLLGKFQTLSVFNPQPNKEILGILAYDLNKYLSENNPEGNLDLAVKHLNLRLEKGLPEMIEKENIKGSLDAGLKDMADEYKPVLEKRSAVIEKMLNVDVLLEYTFKSKWYREIPDKENYVSKISSEVADYVGKKREALNVTKASEEYLALFNSKYFSLFNEKLVGSEMNSETFKESFNYELVEKELSELPTHSKADGQGFAGHRLT